VRNWMKASKDPPKKLGRPAHSRGKKYHALRVVGRQRKVQGKRAGWRPIDKALCGAVPLRLVQESLKLWKTRDRKRKRKRIERHRVSMMVNAKNVIWTLDETHLGRRDDGKAVKSQVVKDRGTLQTVGLSTGREADSVDVIKLLELKKRRSGMLPLVLQTDNGPPFCSDETQDYLEQEGIVPLLSRVYTATDNGAAEIGIRELKEESGLGRGVRLRCDRDAALLLANAAVLVNESRLRGSRGYVSSNSLAKTMPTWYDRVSREQFYEEACREAEEAAQGKSGQRARQAKRYAVFMVLKKYGLITINRGGRPLETPN